MKRITIFLLLLMTSYSQVLVQNNGYSLTQAHVNEVIKFASFLIGQELPASEYANIKQEVINEFNTNPQVFMQGITSISTQMQQVYQLQDPTQQALIRSALLAQYYPALVQEMQQTGKPSYMMRLIDKYSPIIVVDQSAQLAFTDKDLEGFIQYAQVLSEMSGQPVEQISKQYMEKLREVFQESFTQLDPQTKQVLCVMHVFGPVMKQAWAQLTPQQKQQFKAQMQQQQQQYANNYNQQGQQHYTKEQKEMAMQMLRQKFQERSMLFNTMQNIMNMQHVGTMNMIENIGGGNTEWYLDNNY